MRTFSLESRAHNKSKNVFYKAGMRHEYKEVVELDLRNAILSMGVQALP